MSRSPRERGRRAGRRGTQLTSSLLSVPGCLHTRHSLEPHRGRMLGSRLDVQPIAGPQGDVAVPRVEHDAPRRAVQDLVVLVGVPPVRVAGTVGPPPNVPQALVAQPGLEVFMARLSPLMGLLGRTL